MRDSGRLRGRVLLPFALCSLLVVLFIAQLGLHVVSTSATTDEPIHLLAGHRHLACGDFAFNPEHPPLLKELAAWPLQGRSLRMPERLPCAPGFLPKAEAFRLGALFVQENGGERILIPARMMAMLLSILLSLLVWAAAWRMFGAWPAVGAMALFAMEPVLVAHGSLVTTDMAITATSFLAAMTIYSSRSWTPWRRVLAMGGAFGLMLASKHSALLILPILALLRLADATLFREGPWRRWPCLGRPLLELGAAACIGLGILWAFYGFRYSATPGASSTVDLAGFIDVVGKPGARDIGIAKLLPWIGSLGLLPEAYVMGLTDIVGTSVRNTRVLGTSYQQGQWLFYPVAFAVKSSIPLLLLLPVGVCALAMDRTRRRQLLYLLVPPVVFLAIAMSSKFTGSVRHILQVYPYFILVAGFGLSALWARGRGWRLAAAILLVYQAVAVVRTAPDYIPFANAFWGGPAKAHDVLTFGSVEWGQSLKRIHAHVDRNGIRRCWIAGVDDPLLFAQMQPCKRLPEGRFWRSRRGGVEPVPRVIDGTVYLGVRMAASREGDTYASLFASKGDMLAGAVFVYEGRFDLPGVAALGHAMRADELAAKGDLDGALREGAAAIALAEDDPRGWISYAEALLASGQRQAAERAHARAQAAVANDPEHEFFASGRLAELGRRVGLPQ